MESKISYTFGKDGSVTQIATQEVLVKDPSGKTDSAVTCIMQRFTHPVNGTVRVLHYNGEAYFVLEDLARGLGYESTEAALADCRSARTMEITSEETPGTGLLSFS